MTDTPLSDDVVERLDVAERGLMVATVASCNCDHPANISPEPEAHTNECRYRVLIVAAHALADARAALEAARYGEMVGATKALLAHFTEDGLHATTGHGTQVEDVRKARTLLSSIGASHGR